MAVSSSKHSWLLTEAEIAAQAGDYGRARRLSQQATEADPQDVESWLVRAKNAAALSEVLTCLSRVHVLDPKNPLGRQLTYQALGRLLKQEPFLAYKDENDQLYLIRNGQDLSLTVPKDRAIPEPYPLSTPKPLTMAFYLLGWATLGLALAGLGALIFAPLAALWAMQVYLSGRLNPGDGVRISIIFLLAGALLILAFLLVFLFFIHFL